MYTDDHRLKKSVEIGGKKYEIRSDFGVILDTKKVSEDTSFSEADRVYMILNAFYVDFDSIPPDCYQEAMNKWAEYVQCGIPVHKGSTPHLVDWEQDWPLIVGAINRILGYDIRSIPYDVETNTGGVSWETCMSGYVEIGPDCLWAQIVGMRDKLARGKKLEKHEREWYRQNKELVDFKTKYTNADDELIRDWI